MARHLRLIRIFVMASAQEELSYRANLGIGLMNALLKLGTGWLGLVIIFGQVDTLQGWYYASALVVLGVYLLMGGIRDLVIVPSLNQLVGLDGDIWKGVLDFTLLRPVNIQFLVSLRRWHIFAVFDLFMASVVIGVACTQLSLSTERILSFWCCSPVYPDALCCPADFQQPCLRESGISIYLGV